MNFNNKTIGYISFIVIDSYNVLWRASNAKILNEYRGKKIIPAFFDWIISTKQMPYIISDTYETENGRKLFHNLVKKYNGYAYNINTKFQYPLSYIGKEGVIDPHKDDPLDINNQKWFYVIDTE